MLDVIIVGAGPVGLMLAGQLQRRGVSYRLLEARSGRDYWCKALGVSPRTLEIFDQLGFLDEAMNRGLLFTGVNTFVGGKLVARVERQPDTDPYNALALGQYDTEEVLEADLRRHGGHIEWNQTVSAVEVGADSVRVRVGEEWLESRYLVGCDGAHSLVRKTLGLAFEGEKYPLTFMLGDIEMDWPHPHSEVCKLVVLDDEGKVRNVVVVVPIPGNPRRYRLSMAGASGERTPTLEEIRAVAAPALPPGTVVENLRWSSYYSISHRLVSRYQEGRVFLAGDAAHIHPPIGGLGMNTGLQDAYNLGWKLARGGEKLLATYHEERHRVGEEVVGLTAGRMNDALSKKERNEADEERANTQFYVNYRGLTLGQGGGGLGAQPGERLDFVDGLVRPGLNRRARLIDLMRDGGFHLFGYGGGWTEFRALAARLRGALGACAWAISPSSVDLAEEVPWLCGDVQSVWGEGPGAILVRPDGYVAWRGAPTGDAQLEAVLDVLATTR